MQKYDSFSGPGVLWAPLICGKCGVRFHGNVYTVVCFLSRPFCRPCVEEVNALRVRLGGVPWGIPENAYAPDVEAV